MRVLLRKSLHPENISENIANAEITSFFLKVIEYISQRELNNACLTVTDEFKLAAFHAFSFLQLYFTD